MRALVTGMGGTVAPALAQRLSEAGHTVLRWDRSVVPTDDPGLVSAFIRESRLDWFFHLATGSPLWAEWAARACAEQGVKFLFTSSVCVFSPHQPGPLSVTCVPQPLDDYGRYKLECEQRVQAAHPGALVVRLGWQIGRRPGANHMVDHLERTFQSQGSILASTRWQPACSFLPDTALSLLQVMGQHPPGAYHLEGNPGLSFHEIAVRLNRLLGERWVVNPGPDPAFNQRMADARVRVRHITRRLPAIT